MASVIIAANGHECIASGVVLADAHEPFQITISEDDEQLTLRCRLVENDPGEPGISFHGVDGQTAHVVLANLARVAGFPYTFGPLAVATFKNREMSLIFHVTHALTTVEVSYSFWVQAN